MTYNAAWKGSNLNPGILMLHESLGRHVTSFEMFIVSPSLVLTKQFIKRQSCDWQENMKHEKNGLFIKIYLDNNLNGYTIQNSTNFSDFYNVFYWSHFTNICIFIVLCKKRNMKYLYREKKVSIGFNK